MPGKSSRILARIVRATEDLHCRCVHVQVVGGFWPVLSWSEPRMVYAVYGRVCARRCADLCAREWVWECEWVNVRGNWYGSVRYEMCAVHMHVVEAAVRHADLRWDG